MNSFSPHMVRRHGGSVLLNVIFAGVIGCFDKAPNHTLLYHTKVRCGHWNSDVPHLLQVRQECEFFLGSSHWCSQRWCCNIPSEDQPHSFGIHIQKDTCRLWGCHRLPEPTDGNKGFCVRCPWWKELGQDTSEGSRDQKVRRQFGRCRYAGEMYDGSARPPTQKISQVGAFPSRVGGCSDQVPKRFFLGQIWHQERWRHCGIPSWTTSFARAFAETKYLASL